MFKTFGIAAFAVVVALVMGFGARGASTPTAHAETTDVVVIGCEFIAGSVDGVTTDTINNEDVQAACGGDATGSGVLGFGTSLPATGTRSIASLADAIGDEDGTLEASDFRSDSLDENWDNNQISTDCNNSTLDNTERGSTYADGFPPATVQGSQLLYGLACTLDVFVFVNDEGPVTIDLPSGLATIENGNLDFTCTMDTNLGVSGLAQPLAGVTAATAAITAATNATPVVISTASTLGLLTGDTVTVANVLPANQGANGTWVVGTIVANTSIELLGSVGAAAYVSGGTWTQTITAATATFTTAAAHGLAVGDVVTIAGSPVVGANGQWAVATVPSLTTFTLAGFVASGTVPTVGGTAGTVTKNTGSTLDMRVDNDCADGTVPALGTDTNGDGVVLFHVIVDTTGAGAGSVKTVNVVQEQVAQTFDINVVGPANNVVLTLVESLIETNGSSANALACQTGTPVTEGVAPPTSTVGIAVVTDQDDTPLARVPVYFSVTPPEDFEIARIGLGNPGEEITSNTFFTLQPGDTALGTAAYVVICGGKETGTATIDAEINILQGTILSSTDHSAQDITVGGAPSSNVLTAEASTIKCDGTEKSTVTAKVTDSAGNNVADGVPVNFSVVALGTANPINTVTTDGIATSVITPLSNSSAGVTVIVSAGDPDIASVVQTSVRVDCALPLATQPTLAAAAPTPRGGIAGPDTGNGGYLNQNGSNGFPMWTLIALALGSMTLVAGGLVTRRSGK